MALRASGLARHVGEDIVEGAVGAAEAGRIERTLEAEQVAAAQGDRLVQDILDRQREGRVGSGLCVCVANWCTLKEREEPGSEMEGRQSTITPGPPDRSLDPPGRPGR